MAWIVSGNSFTQGAQPKSFFVEEFSPRMLRSLDSCVTEAISMGQTLIPVTIHTPGGCCFILNGAISIFEKAKENGVQIATIVSGTAQSAGALLFLCGAYRFMSKNAHLMIHAPSLSDAGGKLTEVKSLVGALEKMERPLLETISKNLGKRANWLEKKISAQKGVDWYVDSDQALSENLCTHVHNPTFRLELSSQFYID